jgi:hypothetical protein
VGLTAFVTVSCTNSAERQGDATIVSHSTHDGVSHALASVLPETPLRVLAYFRCPSGNVIWTINTRALTELHLGRSRRIDLPAIGEGHYSDGENSIRYLRPGLELRLGGAAPISCLSHVPEDDPAFQPSE